MVPPPHSSQSQLRSGTFSPVPAQTLQTGGLNHSPHPSQAGALSAGASSSTNSPTTGNSSIIKITVAQVFLLLSTLKDDKDRAKWELQADQLKKLIDENGMEVFSKYFARLVTQNAPTIFPALNRPVNGNGSYSFLAAEIKKISHDVDQAPKIAESIEQGTEDIFRDFDLSTFMEHFKLDALEKTILALAFKFGSRSDLKTKADAILSTNFPTFVNIISRPDYGAHDDLTPSFIATIVDRYIQGHPPNFNAVAKSELSHKVKSRWSQPDQAPPMDVLSALDLVRVLGEKPPNALTLYIQRTGADFTRDDETCLAYLQNRPTNIQLSEEQVSSALTYTTISLTPRHNPSVLVAALKRVLPETFSWQDVVGFFDQRDVRVSSEQFLRLYNALLPIAQTQDANAPAFQIERLWGGSHWENPETQLSFICAFASLTPDELNASTIPDLEPTFTLDEYDQAPGEAIRARASVAVKHPLVSVAALSAIFQVALHSLHASQTLEAKRLFQEVVVPNLDIFIVSAFGVPKPWPLMAVETLVSLFDNFLHERTAHHDFVLDSLWRKDKEWVVQRLVDAHAMKPMDLELIYNHIMKHQWLDDLVYLPSGFGYDLAAFAHARGDLDLADWARNVAERGGVEISGSLTRFLMIKANMELQNQRQPDGQLQPTSTTLQVKTVHAMLQIIEDFMENKPFQDLILLQRHCIVVYARLINYGQGYDDIIDANSRQGNSLPPAANVRMEEHYKTMYGNEIQVKDIVDTLKRYKHSRDGLDQDVFASMIQGLFDEYTHYVDYPLEALATTAVLFGGIISHNLITDLPLKIALGMILEAVRDHPPEQPMYKFGLQALMQLFPRFREWPTFCRELVQIPGLQNTEAWKKAEEVVRDQADDFPPVENGNPGAPHAQSQTLVNGNMDDSHGIEPRAAPFASINLDPPPPNAVFEEPTVEHQDTIQFKLNNLTAARLQSTFGEIKAIFDQRYHQWFASHLVEERAKMQPNYHQVYLDFVKLFQDKALLAEVLRQTYISTARMLNAESTMQNSTERTHLKHLGAWLGLLTIARDQPIKHRNIAFKQLLIEGHDTKRLIVVIPFVCKVLLQGVRSTVYRPPNPWLMDIVRLLVELYKSADLKLNLKFEIEVLCKDLNLDQQTIEPSQELLNRAPVDDVGELAAPDTLEPYENLSLNGMAGGIPTGLPPNPMPVSIPDFSGALQIPPTNEMVVGKDQLQQIVRQALTRALSDIIQPVVDRSVTIAAISTQQMIHKDFATEPDENKIRTCAINMVKATAGSLALVTSKEPLRANFTNHMRNLSNELPQALPEGTIIMCVNMNIDIACKYIEDKAAERAIPEIDELIEPELDNRRRHRAQRPNEPYVDPSLTRWAMTIPHPYKLSPSMSGLNGEQMAIYEDFARQPRAVLPTSAQAHASSASDTTRNIANEVLQETYSAVPNVPTPAETPSLPHLPTQLPYPHVHQGMTNGRPAAHPTQVDARGLADRVTKFLVELQRAATESHEEHFSELPRPHPVLDAVDALTQLIIRTSQSSEDFAFFAAEKICQLMFNQVDHTLFLESLVHVLELLLKIAAGSGTALHERVQAIFYQQPPQVFLNLPLVTALLRTDLLNLQVVDIAMSKSLAHKEENSLEFFERLLDLTLFNDRPVALFADFVRSLENAWTWISEEPELEVSQRLKAKIQGSGLPPPPNQVSDASSQRQDQFDYIFEEWMRLVSNYHAPDKALVAFVKQLRSNNLIANKDDFMTFIRGALDMSIAHYEQLILAGGIGTDAFACVDALVKLIALFAKENITEPGGAVAILEGALLVAIIVLNHHHVTRGELFNQRVFLRFFSMLMHQSDSIFDLSAQGAIVGQEGIEVHQREFLLKLADTFLQLAPTRFPGFAFGWLVLIQHRQFLPDLMNLDGRRGWLPFTKIMVALLSFASEHMKTIDVHDVAKDFVRSTTKFLVVVQHDYPDFIVANYARLCASIPPHITQLRNIVLMASPRTEALDSIDAIASEVDNAREYLRDNGLLELLDQLLQDGPSEDAIAHVTHAINRNDSGTTVFGNVSLGTNRALIDAVVAYVGNFAVKRAHQDGNLFVPGATDVSTLSLLVHELGPEQRYFLLSRIMDELRYPNHPNTNYFSHVLLEQWGHDINDPEEVDIRQQLVRIILERFSGFWPQPWGLMYMVIELTKNDKYMFFDQPFIKAAPEVGDKFQAIYRTVADLA
ncbi:CCR4-Not complex component, Not1-domain-containing protein [Pseudomassariella vexata]|uniref:General negative regulator of transcription subunit 1 n=1 Tax=Pseudomassariella vexata TaxID=1141098 RepID=A0A1Y2DU12_9PEZI|nr:CCR4-Not complex component, Not1-domain-containing protein [Pseudomassariella vexata]ORY62659.1 CCR4-Not complex component, Not1-domain-containing protein [Pseudomassariella vexata]